MCKKDEIIKVRESLRREYSEIEYNRIAEKLRYESGEDIEVLAYMSYDRMLSLPNRLFAVAAMR